MTWKRANVHDKVDPGVPVDINGAVSTHYQAAQDDEQLLVHRGKVEELQDGVVAAPQSLLMQRKPIAGWGVGSLVVLFLVVVLLSVVEGGTLHTPRELQATATSAADWTELLPHDVVRHLDTQVDPCNDLYAFSCGSWLKQTAIPNDTSYVSLYFSSVIEQNEKVTEEVMGQGWPFLGELYDSCMNFSNTSSTTADEVSVALLSPVIKQIGATTSKRELFQLAGMLSKAGLPFLTAIEIAPDAGEATVYAMYASQSGLTLSDPQSYLDRQRFDAISGALYAYGTQLFSLAGWESRAAALQASSVIGFQQTLAGLFVPRAVLRNPAPAITRTSVVQAAEKYPLLFAQFMNGSGMLQNLIARNSSVIIEPSAFFERTEKLVTGDSITLDTLKAMLTFQYIESRAIFLSEPFVQAMFVFYDQTLRGQKARYPRRKLCLTLAKNTYPDLTGKYFARYRFDEASEQLANQLVTQLRASLQKDLMQADWMDEPTRHSALGKLGNMTNLIGYSNLSANFPYKLRSDAPLAENMRIIREHEFDRAGARLGGRVNRNEWTMSGAEVNGQYMPVTNRITIPAGILQPPFFSNVQQPARNFGAIGQVIGHELMHGFDNLGRRFGFDGSLRDWWSNATATEYLRRSDCFARQYSGFAVTSGTDQGKVLGFVNGNLTLGENMADNVGLKVSFQAYQSFVAEQVKEMSKIKQSGTTVAPGSQIEQSLSADVAEKLFFISFAQAQCSKLSDASVAQNLITSPHPPGQWRANGVAMNSHDFARVFSCPAGSPMNPSTKCQLW
uniref:Peptidase M13 C-terminal domain-containing protein n=1 Tax=Hyaloperonospora arabidopsidis (strain Emoy2) TaxID=559515 RepID=M4B1V1_HYAAE